MTWLAPATGKRGRCPTFSDAAIQFCLTIKCLFGFLLYSLYIDLSATWIHAEVFSLFRLKYDFA
jgi:hypothetical protein